MRNDHMSEMRAEEMANGFGHGGFGGNVQQDTPRLKCPPLRESQPQDQEFSFNIRTGSR